MINIQNTILGKIVDRKHEELAARLKQRNFSSSRLCKCFKT